MDLMEKNIAFKKEAEKLISAAENSATDSLCCLIDNAARGGRTGAWTGFRFQHRQPQRSLRQPTVLRRHHNGHRGETRQEISGRSVLTGERKRTTSDRKTSYYRVILWTINFHKIQDQLEYSTLVMAV